MYLNTVADLRATFASLLASQKFTSVNREATMTALTGGSTIEVIGATFLASEDALFGEVNWDYVRREEEWYNSQSLSVNDIPGGPPQVWKAVADKDGFINSNYGWCIYNAVNVHGFGIEFTSGDKRSQYGFALEELKKNPESRRAVMIYTRPQMWLHYNIGGRSDFMCTNVVQYLIRDGKVHAIVQMRSNDAVFGYKNDRAWQQHVLEKLAADLGIPPGDIIWHVGSIHVYARHFYLVHHFSETGDLNITKAKYDELYPDSPYK